MTTTDDSATLAVEAPNPSRRSRRRMREVGLEAYYEETKDLPRYV